MRVDKFLWSVRIFKTRSLATDACRNDKVFSDKVSVKAHKEIVVGNILDIKLGIYTKTIEILDIPKSRVGAKLVENYIKDLTPDTEYLKLDLVRERHVFDRPQGSGRPTKKERRQIDEWLDS